LLATGLISGLVATQFEPPSSCEQGFWGSFAGMFAFLRLRLAGTSFSMVGRNGLGLGRELDI